MYDLFSHLQFLQVLEGEEIFMEWFTDLHSLHSLYWNILVCHFAFEMCDDKNNGIF